jgi:hypothetical protein
VITPTFLSFKFLFLASNKSLQNLWNAGDNSQLHAFRCCEVLVIGIDKEAAEAVETYPL